MSEPAKTDIQLQSITDIATVGELKTQLTSALAEGQPVSIDAANVERIDAASLQLLTAFVCVLKNQQQQCEWQGVSDAVRDAARLCGLDDILNLTTIA